MNCATKKVRSEVIVTNLPQLTICIVQSGETPLLSLVQRNSPPSKVALLLQAGADVNRPNLLGETAVMVGAQNRVSAPLMELLLRAGGHVNQPSSVSNHVLGVRHELNTNAEGSPH